GVELHRRAAGGADAVLDVHGELAQMEIARTDLDPRVGDADERLLQIGVREADRFEHRARGRAARTGGQRIRHATTAGRAPPACARSPPRTDPAATPRGSSSSRTSRASAASARTRPGA